MESPLIEKKWKKGMHSLDIVYPNLYSGGIYCLAPTIVYNIVQNIDNWICNRVFLDKGEIKSKLIGFTLQYEPDYYNVLKILKKNNISLSKNREEILFAGGPCVNANHKTMEDYFDFFFLGEAEETLLKVLDEYEKNQDKKTFLKKISNIIGVYVPGISKNITKAVIGDLDKIPYPFYQPMPNEGKLLFGKVFILEIERGCPFKCHFCALPNFHPKQNHRSLEKIKEIIDSGLKINKRNKVIIYSPSFSHPKRKEILKYLLEKKVEFSVPSIKVELVDEELLKLISKGGQRTLTVAPECNEKLRGSIGKPMKDELFFNFAKMTNKQPFKTIKLYFMIGLPNQEEKDLKEMVEFIKEMKKISRHKVYASINPFIPKPGTKLADTKFDKIKVKKHAAYLKKELGKLGIRLKLASLSNYHKQWLLGKADKLPITR
ncbi:MAG: radical SAM protein [archaeon]